MEIRERHHSAIAVVATAFLLNLPAASAQQPVTAGALPAQPAADLRSPLPKPEAPIIVTFQGTASGMLDGAAFSPTEFVITATGRLSSRSQQELSWLMANDSASVTLGGIGSYDFVTPSEIWITGGATGFRPAGAFDRTNFSGAGISEWHGTTPIGPLTGEIMNTQWGNTSFETTGGTLFLDAALGSGTFEARIPQAIVYFYSGEASGVLDGSPFSTTPILITATSVAPERLYEPGLWTSENSATLVELDGLGVFEIIDGTSSFVNNTVQLGGISTAGGLDLLGGPTNAALESWYMTSSIGPLTGGGGYIQTVGVNTTGGSLQLDAADGLANLLFSAVIPDVLFADEFETENLSAWSTSKP